MEEVRKTVSNLLKSWSNRQTEQSTTSTQFEKAFVKLWTILSAHYQQQNFIGKLGEFDSTIAKLWRSEFQKAGIGYDEIVIIGNNLSSLKSPEFIPNVFQLIGIVKDMSNDLEFKVAHERIPTGLPNLMSPEETKALQEETKAMRIEALKIIREML